ncbi:MAG: cobalamin-dependent protein, partial [Acidobacteriota bacterium]
MNVLLISSNTERINMVTIPLGLGLVAAATRRAGHEVTFLDLLNAGDPEAAIRRTIAAARPDVIGISVRNIDDQTQESPRFLLAQVKPVVAACRAGSAAPIVLGGAGYSIFPAAALAFLGADYGVCGDGEVVFQALLACLQAGGDPAELPGVHMAGRPAGKRPAFAADLDSLPVWDDALSSVVDPATPELWIPLQTRRGCPNDCSYCSTAAVQGRKIRSRSPRQVVERMALLAAAGFRRF